jgi:HK97 family phage major capsid protein
VENNELKDALDALTVKLEGKTAEQVKEAVDAFKKENEDLLSVDVKGINDKLDGLKDVNTNIEAMQKHLDTLDVKLQDKKAGTKEDEPKDLVKSLIVDNYDQIKEVTRKKHVFVEDTKAVGNMTLSASLTGDQPRTFASQVYTIPNQILNFAELCGVINIGNGTYTFPRRTTSEGGAGTQTEGSDKSQVDYDLAMIDVNTDFIAGFCVYSKKMANNLPFLESFLPGELRRSYFDAENSSFNTTLAAAATASAVVSGNKIERLISEIATLEGANYSTSGIVLSPADYWDILVTEKSTGAGYGLPGVVSLEGGQLRINGIPLLKANWLAANKYYVGDWSTVAKVVTEGLSVQFSTEDEDNFRKNNITARVEAQVGLAVHRPDAIIYGDFTATA